MTKDNSPMDSSLPIADGKQALSMLVGKEHRHQKTSDKGDDDVDSDMQFDELEFEEFSHRAAASFYHREEDYMNNYSNVVVKEN